MDKSLTSSSSLISPRRKIRISSHLNKNPILWNEYLAGAVSISQLCEQPQPLLGVEWTFLHLQTWQVRQEQIKKEETLNPEPLSGTHQLLEWPQKIQKRVLNCPSLISCHLDLETNGQIEGKSLEPVGVKINNWIFWEMIVIPVPCLPARPACLPARILATSKLKINISPTYISQQTNWCYLMLCLQRLRAGILRAKYFII